MIKRGLFSMSFGVHTVSIRYLGLLNIVQLSYPDYLESRSTRRRP